jgi:hypothetical protein
MVFFRQLILDSIPISFPSYDMYKYDRENNPLLQRAWVFQERVLSPRVVYFTTDGIYYECMQDSRSDWFTGDWFTGGSGPESRSMFRALPSDGYVDPWRKIIFNYTSLSMSFEKDKLPAISGVAKHVASSRAADGFDPGQYLAGLWEKTLASDLTWHSTSPRTRPMQWRAPSWSWASVHGLIRHSGKCDLNLLEWDIQPKGPDMYGELSSASIDVSTRLLRGTLRYGRQLPFFKHDPLYTVILCSAEIKLNADYELHLEGEHHVGDGSEVFCLLILQDWGHHELQGCLVLQSVNVSSRTFRRIGIIETYSHSAFRKELLEIKQQEEVRITFV